MSFFFENLKGFIIFIYKNFRVELRGIIHSGKVMRIYIRSHGFESPKIILFPISTYFFSIPSLDHSNKSITWTNEKPTKFNQRKNDQIKIKLHNNFFILNNYTAILMWDDNNDGKPWWFPHTQFDKKSAFQIQFFHVQKVCRISLEILLLNFWVIFVGSSMNFSGWFRVFW